MPSVFLFSPLLAQCKPPLFFLLLLLAGIDFPLPLILLALELECLLRFGSDAGAFLKLFSDCPLQSFGIAYRFGFFGQFDRRAETKPTPVFQQIVPNFVIFGFRTEGDFAYLVALPGPAFYQTDPEWRFKTDCQCDPCSFHCQFLLII